MSYRKKLILRRAVNIVGNGENAGNQHFLLFPPCFPELYFPRLHDILRAWKRVLITDPNIAVYTNYYSSSIDCKYIILSKPHIPIASFSSKVGLDKNA